MSLTIRSISDIHYKTKCIKTIFIKIRNIPKLMLKIRDITDNFQSFIMKLKEASQKNKRFLFIYREKKNLLALLW